MQIRLRATFLFAIAAAATCGCSRPAAPPFTVVMDDCKASRPGMLKNPALLNLLFGGGAKDSLVKRGVVERDGQKYTLYLPKEKPYSIKNTKPSDDGFENTATPITVEQKGEGPSPAMDDWYANLPIRLGDAMYDVTEIAADGSRIVLQPSTSPLRGVIVGRACPTFSYKTADGKIVSRESMNGQAYLLDIWSTT